MPGWLQIARLSYVNNLCSVNQVLANLASAPSPSACCVCHLAVSRVFTDASLECRVQGCCALGQQHFAIQQHVGSCAVRLVQLWCILLGLKFRWAARHFGVPTSVVSVEPLLVTQTSLRLAHCVMEASACIWSNVLSLFL